MATSSGIAVCRDVDERLLLTRFASEGNPDHGKWTMPGGGMKWGESPADTVRRELWEETGLDGVVGSVLGVFSHWFTADESVRGESGHVLGLLYEIGQLSGDLRTEWAADTTDAAEWFALAEIQSLPRVPLVDFVINLL